MLYEDLHTEHKKTLDAMKNSIQGKTVVLVASGPTGNIFKKIDNAIYIGINHTAFNKFINFDYIFIQDNVNIVIEQCKKIEKKTKIVCGIHISYPNRLIQPDKYFTNYLTYYVHSLLSCTPQKLDKDILYNTIDDFTSTVFSAMQIIAWCQPQKIYLVGCDCTANTNFINCAANLPYYKIIPCWRLIRDFIKEKYPTVAIFSVNPWGLKGVFKEIYQSIDLQYIMEISEGPQKYIAWDLVDRAVREEPDNFGLRSIQLTLRKMSGDTQSALELASEWVDLFPFQENGWLEYSLLAEATGQEQKAVNCSCKALALAPDSCAVQAHVCLQLRRHTAEHPWAELAKLVADIPGKEGYWATALSLEAGYLKKKGKYIQSQAYYAEALALRPNDFWLRTEIIDFFRQAGDYVNAIKLTREGLKLWSEWPEGWHQMALTQERLRSTKAVHSAYKAMELAPLAMHYRGHLARIFRKMRRLDEAKAAIEEALDLYPEWPDGYYHRSLNDLSAGLHKQALASALRAVELLPPELNFDRPYALHLVSLLLKAGRSQDAEKLVREFLEQVPEWGAGWKILSEIYENRPLN